MSTVRTKCRVVDRILVVKGGNEPARGRVPKLGGSVFARCQDASTVGTKLRIDDPILVPKDCDDFARGRSPKFGGFVCARR
jgi:hypothetical protein